MSDAGHESDASEIGPTDPILGRLRAWLGLSDPGLWSMPEDVGETAARPRHLSLVTEAEDSSGPDAPPSPGLEVRSARRSLARLMRALQGCGFGSAGWPHEVTTRFAHADAVTQRYVIDGAGAPEEVQEAVAALRSIRSWAVDRLDPEAARKVRTRELQIAVTDEDLEQPLVQLDALLDEAAETWTQVPQPRSLRAGLRACPPERLYEICQRLGVPSDPGTESGNAQRFAAEQAVFRTLRDGHLLGILVATLPPEVHAMLSAVVRESVGRATMARLTAALEASGAEAPPPSREVEAVRALLGCGLVYLTEEEDAPTLWVPTELQHRLDGVLRAFGI